jgi:hypothetical protein
MLSAYLVPPRLARFALVLSAVLSVACLGVPAAHAMGRVTAPITLKFQSWDPPDGRTSSLRPVRSSTPTSTSRR